MTITPSIQLGPAFAAFTDDTEESIVGSDYHQRTITLVYTSLAACGPERGLPWYIGNQLRMVIPREGGGTLSLSSDLLVHPNLRHLPNRDALHVATEGLPTLVIEVASPSTALTRDLQEKRDLYAHLGIAEYLVFDPAQRFIPDLLTAWKLPATGHHYQPWLPEADGRWHSTLGIAFAIAEPFLRVYDQEGQLVLTRQEEALQRHQAEATRQQLADQLAAERRRTAALEAELRRLRDG